MVSFLFMAILSFIPALSINILYIDFNETINGDGSLESPFNNFSLAYNQIITTSVVKFINDYSFVGYSESLVFENLQNNIRLAFIFLTSV